MGVNVNGDDITMDNVTMSINELYDEVSKISKTSMKKLNDSYVLNGEIKLTNSSKLIILNSYVEIGGEYITIESGCTLQLGEITSNNQTINGSYLKAKNLKLKYGFGNKVINNSGDLLVYGSVIDAWCFWSFFKGDNLVEIIDSRINGFGRISGAHSIVRNVEFHKSEGRYGFLALKGDIKEYTGIIVKDTEPHGEYNCSVYFNPRLSSHMVISNSYLSGYDQLVYIEPSKKKEDVTLLDSVATNGYSVHRSDDNVDFYLKYTFNPIIINTEGYPLSNIYVDIYDNDDKLVHSEQTLPDGTVDTRLTVYENLGDGTENYYNPFKIVIYEEEDKKQEIQMKINRKIDKHYIVHTTNNNSVDYNKIHDIINKAVKNKQEFEILI